MTIVLFAAAQHHSEIYSWIFTYFYVVKVYEKSENLKAGGEEMTFLIVRQWASKNNALKANRFGNNFDLTAYV